jgi:hypothetical protein
MREWISAARDAYDRNTRVLSGVKYGDQRKKHVLRTGTAIDPITQSEEKKSIVFPEFHAGLPKLMWYLMGTTWGHVLEGRHVFRAIDCGFMIGASQHTETSYILFDIQPPNCHSYPVLKSEVEGSEVLD